MGAKERNSKKVRAQVVGITKQNTLHEFIENNIELDSIVNTDHEFWSLKTPSKLTDMFDEYEYYGFTCGEISF